jgi:hypothetical protein
MTPPPPAVRAWLYGIMVAAAALAVIYGIVTVEQAGGWVVLFGALLGASNGLALANITPKKGADNGTA